MSSRVMTANGLIGRGGGALSQDEPANPRFGHRSIDLTPEQDRTVSRNAETSATERSPRQSRVSRAHDDHSILIGIFYRAQAGSAAIEYKIAASCRMNATSMHSTPHSEGIVITLVSRSNTSAPIPRDQRGHISDFCQKPPLISKNNTADMFRNSATILSQSTMSIIFAYHGREGRQYNRVQSVTERWE